MNAQLLPAKPLDDAAGWDQALYAFLVGKGNRSGSRRTVEGYGGCSSSTRRGCGCSRRTGERPETRPAGETIRLLSRGPAQLVRCWSDPCIFDLRPTQSGKPMVNSWAVRPHDQPTRSRAALDASRWVGREQGYLPT